MVKKFTKNVISSNRIINLLLYITYIINNTIKIINILFEDIEIYRGRKIKKKYMILEEIKDKR